MLAIRLVKPVRACRRVKHGGAKVKSIYSKDTRFDIVLQLVVATTVLVKVLLRVSLSNG